MIVLSDNDVGGAVRALRFAIEANDCAEFLEALTIEFKELQNAGLAYDSPDQVIWDYCQTQKCVLLTADRSENDAEGSFECIIKHSGDETSLPIITIADPKRLTRDRDYAASGAFKLLDYLDPIDELLGTGRIYLSA